MEVNDGSGILKFELFVIETSTSLIEILHLILTCLTIDRSALL